MINKIQVTARLFSSDRSGSFPLSPFLSSQGERGKWFRHRLWLVMSGVVVVAAGSYGSNLLKGLNHTQRRVVYL